MMTSTTSPADATTSILLGRMSEFLLKQNENMDSLRTLAAKLHTRTCAQDKRIRETTLDSIRGKQFQNISMLMSLLEFVRDTATACSIAGILHECVSVRGKGKNKNRGKEARKAVAVYIVSIGGTVTIIRMVSALCVRTTAGGASAVQQAANEQLLYELLWLLAQLAQKGK
ncbi:uncharacterized protein LOC113375009 [Ctenocephalides felis]|uniref:uncharacterized protein LOC113375009 n=1 Tax=Ctenocephalides felis TaxID=7515 RepID=UPI000E6E4AC2|nr:uncharacterized protein LOC113375009 [Ctenocephalides felis]